MYGCAAVEPLADGASSEVRVVDLVEKPESAEAPSNLAIIGRYVLDPAVFEVLRHTAPGRGGEIQLTDALRVLAERCRHRTAAASQVSCSGDGGTTPGTSCRTCRPSSGWRASGPTSARSSCRGCDSSSPRSPRRADADVADAVLQPGSPAVGQRLKKPPASWAARPGRACAGPTAARPTPVAGSPSRTHRGSRAPAAEPRCRPAREALRRALVRARGPAPRARPPAPGPVPARVRARSLGSLLLLRSRGRTR